MDGGLHFFTGSSSVSLTDLPWFRGGRVGSLLLSCGAHFCKSLKVFSAEVPKVGSECVHWILMAIRKTQWWDGDTLPISVSLSFTYHEIMVQVPFVSITHLKNCFATSEGFNQFL